MELRKAKCKNIEHGLVETSFRKKLMRKEMEAWTSPEPPLMPACPPQPANLMSNQKQRPPPWFFWHTEIPPFLPSSSSFHQKMEDFVVNIIALGVISWTTCFLLLRRIIFPERSFEFSNRIVSTVHAVFAVILSSLSVKDWRCPCCPLASKSSAQQMQTLAVSVSYLIYDLVCCQFDKRINLDNAIHHLVSIVGLGAGLAYQRCGSEMVAALWITEISGPFLHLRELLKELGYRDTDLNLTADYAFAVTFSLARMVGGPYLTYVTLSAPNPFLIKAMAVGLQLVSAFWFYKILRMVRQKWKKRAATRKTDHSCQQLETKKD